MRDLEQIGIVDQRQRDRETYGRFVYRPPSAARAKVHRIAVDLKTGERTVEEGAQIIVQPPKIVRPIVIPDTPPTRRHEIPSARYTTREILEAVAEAFQVSLYALLSPERSDRIARPRFAAAKLLRDKRELSYPRIGFSLGRRDHTTVIHEVRRAAELMEIDPDWAESYRAAEHALLRKRRV